MGEVDSDVLTGLFQHQVLEAMVAERRLSRDFAQKLRTWHPSGFGVYRSRPIDPDDRPALERLAAYLLRPSFAASRLHYDPEQGRIEYRTAKGVRRTLDALDWIALVTSHIPSPGEQMSRYYGRYSNASRGKRLQASTRAAVSGASPEPDSEEPSAAESFSQQRRRSWARLLRRIYEVDALKCPQCGSALEIIAVIEQSSVIRKILQHLDHWEQPQRAPPPRLFPQNSKACCLRFRPSRLRPAEPPMTRSSGTRSRIGKEIVVSVFRLPVRVSSFLSFPLPPPLQDLNPGSSFIPQPTPFQPLLARYHSCP